MKENEESVAYRQEEEFETRMTTYEIADESGDDMAGYYKCPIHGKVRGTSCPYCKTP